MTVARLWAPLAAIATLLVFAQPSEAQKRCRKGIPCGNTCISAAKTCHVGIGRCDQCDTARLDRGSRLPA